MANAILTSPIQADGLPEWSRMPNQALVAILTNGVYQLSYRRSFDGLAPSLASAITAGAALQASPGGQPVLLGSQPVDFNADTVGQNLLTVPEGFVFVLYRVDIRNVSVSLTTASVSFGFNDPDLDDVIADSTYTALTDSALYQTVFPKVGATVGEGNQIFGMLVNTPEGSAATGIVDVFGYLIAV